MAQRVQPRKRVGLDVTIVYSAEALSSGTRRLGAPAETQLADSYQLETARFDIDYRDQSGLESISVERLRAAVVRERPPVSSGGKRNLRISLSGNGGRLQGIRRRLQVRDLRVATRQP
jgi:hypothetical protein